MENEFLQRLVQIGGVDITTTLDRFMDNEKLYLKILLKFPNDQTFKNLKKSIASNNIPDAFMYAHTMKGVAGNLGLQNLLDILTPLTEDLRGGKTNSIQSFMETLTLYYDNICHLIKQMKD
ncbi:Hpt domain-containing protein [Parabacteroides pacaensis]|uniref:Hpt domain-containing protein n=1 Tax=Parabacteroides pacaensis TaxID=2086575 RepID=UPI000D1025C5|nr:Hpt domain-containing protein [Parabacteroides pacaensis]